MVAPTVLHVRLPEALSSADLARECACLAARLRVEAAAAVVCHADSLAGELASVETLARLSLAARRGGASFAVRGMRPELSSLVELLGLGGPLPPYDQAVRR